MAAAAVLASHSCCHNIGKKMNHGTSGDNLSFLGSLKNYNKVKTRKLRKFRVEMQKGELPPAQLGRYGKVIKMVPTNEIRKRMSPYIDTPEIVNGYAKNVNGVHVATSRSLVKKDPTSPPSELSRLKELPPIEGQKVLPSDENFRWANENYNSVQRTIDVWSCIISLRIRVLLDDAKWTYIGGFSEDKQVSLVVPIDLLSRIGLAGSDLHLSNYTSHVFLIFQKQRRRKTASWLRERILQLGPTLIKLGQLLSTRSDLFPKEYVEELSKLQVHSDLALQIFHLLQKNSCFLNPFCQNCLIRIEFLHLHQVKLKS